MPGYEIERAKLRQYLGIEWVSNGLVKKKGKFKNFLYIFLKL